MLRDTLARSETLIDFSKPPASFTHIMLLSTAAGLAVLFRLYQEVWSNAVVVAPWYGPLVSLRPSRIQSQHQQDLRSGVPDILVTPCASQGFLRCQMRT